MTREIHLRRTDAVTLVDDSDYEYLSQFEWSLEQSGYVTRTKFRSSRIRMHREIVNPPRNLLVDHINRNRLDNRRINLRVCSAQQNVFNRGKCKNTGSFFYSPYKGVTKARSGRYTASIGLEYGRRHLGTFDTEYEAALAYDQAAREAHGRFASCNYELAELSEETQHEYLLENLTNPCTCGGTVCLIGEINIFDFPVWKIAPVWQCKNCNKLWSNDELRLAPDSALSLDKQIKATSNE